MVSRRKLIKKKKAKKPTPVHKEIKKERKTQRKDIDIKQTGYKCCGFQVSGKGMYTPSSVHRDIHQMFIIVHQVDDCDDNNCQIVAL